MKILFVTNHLEGTDGWSRYALNIVQELQHRKMDISCVVSKEHADVPVRQHVVLLDPNEYVVNPFKLFQGARLLRKIIRIEKPDIVHFAVEPYAQMLFFLRRGNGDPKYIVTVHGTYAFIPNILTGFRKALSIIVTRFMFARLSHVIAVSAYTKRYMLASARSVGVSTKCIEDIFTVITNAVESGHVSVTKNQGDTKNIIFVGAIKPRKGLLEAFHALSIYKHTYGNDFCYVIVGAQVDANYFELLKKTIRKLELENNVAFKGRIDNAELDSLYGTADLFLMLSLNDGGHFEGFGLVYLEANARGVPCIGSKDSGAQEAISDGKTGFLVNPHDAE
ncbi:MAG TPA: glycosyltransferase family 4 protein, partial [Candidatus Paceibacterota bacterium]